MKMKGNETVTKEEVFKFLWSCNRCDRISRYYEIFGDIEKNDHYEIFLDVYSDLENNFDWFHDAMVKFMLKLRPEPMRKKIAKFADTDGFITVYRGKGTKSKSCKKALSWTLDRNKAEWFARRFQFSSDDKCYIYTGKVHIDSVVAYNNDRKEKELVCVRGSVAVMKTEKIILKEKVA